MGALVRTIFWLLGYSIPYRVYHCEVTRTVDWLPVKKGNRGWMGGLLHLVPVLVVLLILVGIRHRRITAGAHDIAALLIAVTWIFVGPLFIWYYERYTLPIFNQKAKRILSKESERKVVRKCVYSNIYSLLPCLVISITWTGLGVLAFSRSSGFLIRLGMTPPFTSDPFWWVILVGVALVSYYSSIGFCFSYKAMYLTLLISKSEINRPVYHDDNLFGLYFIGEFAFDTSMMFFSGWLFAPLMVLIAGYEDNTRYGFVGLLLGIYLVYTVVSFLIPIYAIHRKILTEKLDRARYYVVRANMIVNEIQMDWSEEKMKHLEFYEKLNMAVKSLPNWPLNLETVLKFASATILVPSLAAAISTILRQH